LDTVLVLIAGDTDDKEVGMLESAVVVPVSMKIEKPRSRFLVWVSFGNILACISCNAAESLV
jgi:hypothetical protein